MKTFNLDAREFIAQIAKEDIPITQIVILWFIAICLALPRIP